MKMSCYKDVFCSNVSLRIITGSLLFILLGSLFLYLPQIYTAVFFGLISFWILFIEWPRLVPPGSKQFWRITLFYPTIPLISLFALNKLIYGKALLMWMVIVLTIHDGAALSIGKLFGKHLLAPDYSPNKTVEGCLGGFVAVFIAHVMILGRAGTSYGELAIISAMVSILATFGDLFESSFKRKAGVKDSGNILPGHGGLLDRMDALLFLSPCVYLLANELFMSLHMSLFL
jgi:phosphatidate cytidylyltransferase